MDFKKSLSELFQLILQYLPKMGMAVLTLILGLWIIVWLKRLLNKEMQRRDFDPTIRPFLVSLVSISLKVMLILSIAGMFGVETTSFVAIFAALAFAIGSALSGSLGHFASGVLLLIFRTYTVGDYITIGGGQSGVVEGIQVFNTILMTFDNRKIIIPTGVVTSNIMINITGQEKIRVDMTFNVASDSDIDKVRETIQKVADASPLILKTPPIAIVVTDLPIGMIEFAVRPWCDSSNMGAVSSYMKENIKKTFDKEVIKFPTPGMNINLTQ